METHTRWLDTRSGPHRVTHASTCTHTHKHKHKRSKQGNASACCVDTGCKSPRARRYEITVKFTRQQSKGTNSSDVLSIRASELPGRVLGIYNPTFLPSSYSFLRQPLQKNHTPSQLFLPAVCSGVLATLSNTPGNNGPSGHQHTWATQEVNSSYAITGAPKSRTFTTQEEHTALFTWRCPLTRQTML